MYTYNYIHIYIYIFIYFFCLHAKCCCVGTFATDRRHEHLRKRPKTESWTHLSGTEKDSFLGEANSRHKQTWGPKTCIICIMYIYDFTYISLYMYTPRPSSTVQKY